MARSAGAGELRTKIKVFDLPRGQDGEPATDKDGYPVTEPENVFGPGATRQVKWVNAWGSEVYQARQAGSREFAIPFDRQQLADYLGVERSALSAELGKMQREGLLQTKKNHFSLFAPMSE